MQTADRLTGISAGLLTSIALTLLGAPLQGQVLRGTIRDSANAPIRDAIVAAVDRGDRLVGTARSDASGGYRINVGRDIEVSIKVRRLGYFAQQSEFVQLSISDSVSLDLNLRALAGRLTRVVITSQRDSIRHSRLFGMDLRTIGGTIVTPTEVDRAVMGANSALDIFRRQAVVGYTVDSERNCIILERGWPRECLPAVIDGLLTEGDALFVLPPEVVDYMLVLRGHEVGVLYGAIASQGAIIVVTKNGGARGPR